MSLHDVQRIDLVLGPARHAKCTLIIVDGEQHTDQTQRFEMLGRKLTAYFSYIQSTKFAEDHPGVDRSEVLIGVICQQAPSEEMLRLNILQSDDNPNISVRVAVAQHETGSTLPWFVVPTSNR
jgi:hypothetical protein